MRKLLLFIAIINLFHVKAQVASFAWMAGSTFTNQISTYGTLGVASSTNNPGARSLPSSWTTSDGKLWLFGGNGYASAPTLGNTNDLWNYNPSSNEWVWVTGSNLVNQVGLYGTKGVASNTNIPSGRNGSVSWKDNNGNLWLFGGQGYGSTASAGNLNDLWKYNVSTNEWTWVTGSNGINQLGVYGTKGIPSTTNTPGARTEAVSWIDNSGNLWLFGGFGRSSTASDGLLNDLWKFNIATNEWTWVSGSNGINVIGTYGTQGVGSTANIPGTRSASTSFKDANGDLWLFGGNGLGTVMTTGCLSDLWKYNITSNQWTWVSGTNVVGSVGVYGTKGFPATTNRISGRTYAYSWTDSNDNFWIYGGYGASAVAGNGALNDLWQFNKSNNLWVWVSGLNSTGSSAVYGTLGVSSSTNTPGGRHNETGWKDIAGDFWLYGGKAGAPLKSDLWKLNICNAPSMPLTSASQTICIGSATTLTASGIGTLGWYSSAIGGVYLGNGSSFTTPTLTTNTTFYVQDSTCAFSIRNAVTVSATQPTVNIAGTNTVCINSSVILTASGATSYTWSTTQLTNTIAVTPSVTTIYTVTGSDAFGCLSSKTKTITTVALPSVTITGATTICPSTGIFLTASGANTYVWNTGSTATSILVAPSSSFVYTVTGKTTATGCVKTQTALVTVSIPTVVITGSTSVCKGVSINLTAGGASTYTWSTGTQSTNINVTPTVSTIYTVSAKDAFGCNGTDTHTITVLQTPTVSITGNSVTCLGTPITLTANGASSYTWNTGSLNTVETFTPSSLTVYSVTGVDGNGCFGLSTKTISINALPTLSISGVSELCIGSLGNLNVAGASTYTWNTSSTSSSISISPTVTTNYSVIGRAANSCTNSAVKTVTVNVLPILTISGNSIICNGNSTTIDVIGANTYTWSNTSNSPTITITPSITSTYSVIGKDINNCINTAVQTITVNPLPMLNVSTTNPLLCVGETSTLSVIGATSYTWSDNSNGTDIIVTPSVTTNYTVTGVDVNNCSNLSVFTQSVSLCTGIQETNENVNSVFVFPNPNNGEFTIQSQTEEAISIANELGQVIETLELNQTNNFSYKVSQLQNGIYFLVGKTVKQKIIVSK